ncbi:MAG: glycine--tRNA ligase subunit beta, partial [Jiangellaceae bacterium]
MTGLRSEKNMRWNDPALSFTRPIRWLTALLGNIVVPADVSSLAVGRTTRVLRTADQPVVTVPTAAGYVEFLAEHDIVVDANVRRRQIIDMAQDLAVVVGGRVDVDAEAALVDEITNLVEQPNALLGSFEESYLELPEQVLTTVMRKHQRYLPVRATDGSLLPHFVAVANGACDPDVVRAGNEAVLRARYEDAAFFWRADLEIKPEDFLAGLEKLTFEARLGSMADRAGRIGAIAAELAQVAELHGAEAKTLVRASSLAKFDLASQMVVELSSLAGVMAREYAVRAGEPEAVAQALFEIELPRHTSDILPAGTPGAVLALSDRFDLLMGMFALGAKPTGSSDPFGLRRAALGVVQILRAFSDLAAVTISRGLDAAAGQLRTQGVDVSADAVEAAHEFVVGRFEQQLRDEGVPADFVAAVRPGADAPGRAYATLGMLRERADDQQFVALVVALQRIARIVPSGTEPVFDPAVLTEPAEVTLVKAVADTADFSGGDVAEF